MRLSLALIRFGLRPRLPICPARSSQGRFLEGPNLPESSGTFRAAAGQHALGQRLVIGDSIGLLRLAVANARLVVYCANGGALEDRLTARVVRARRVLPAARPADANGAGLGREHERAARRSG